MLDCQWGDDKPWTANIDSDINWQQEALNVQRTTGQRLHYTRTQPRHSWNNLVQAWSRGQRHDGTS